MPPEHASSDGGARRPHASGVATREALLVTAERLFAERGLHTVSLREVAAAAGQRNTRAAQYHFGSLEGLVKAIFDFRLPSIDRRRAELLAELADTDRLTDLRGLTAAIVLPMAEDVTTGSNYVAFLDRLAHEPLHPHAMAEPELRAATLRARDLWLAALTHVPEGLRAERFRLASVLAVASLASRQDQLRGGAVALDHDVVVANLIDAITALATAEVGPATAEALAGAANRRRPVRTSRRRAARP